MRDRVKNRAFFESSLSFTNESINDFENIMPQVVGNQGEESQGAKNGYNALVMYYTKKVNLLYSLGALLKIESSNSNLKILENKIRDAGLNDYLVNYLITFIDSDWELNSNDFYFKGIYEPLKDIINENDKHMSKNMLKKYLENQWYELHNECAWYNSHDSKQGAYYGYWAYEAGAIAKILQLEDKELREQQYYPYDLVHFKE